jgi:hypothetical protein
MSKEKPKEFFVADHKDGFFYLVKAKDKEKACVKVHKACDYTELESLEAFSVDEYREYIASKGDTSGVIQIGEELELY